MEDPTYHLEGVVRNREEMQDFEGPLSLILMLLSKNKIAIRDIKISEILDQYLTYLAQMERMDLEIASEFVQMASYLLYICLLYTNPSHRARNRYRMPNND